MVAACWQIRGPQAPRVRGHWGRGVPHECFTLEGCNLARSVSSLRPTNPERIKPNCWWMVAPTGPARFTHAGLGHNPAESRASKERSEGARPHRPASVLARADKIIAQPCRPPLPPATILLAPALSVPLQSRGRRPRLTILAIRRLARRNPSPSGSPITDSHRCWPFDFDEGDRGRGKAIGSPGLSPAAGPSLPEGSASGLLGW